MDRPRVIICTSASVDGRVTLAPDVLLLYGDERWQAAAGSSDMFDWLKFTHKPQATLEGSGSFVLDSAEPEPLPAVEGDRDLLYEDFLPDAVVQRPGHRGWFTAVDGRGRIRWAYKEWPDEAWAGWHLLVLAAHHTPPEYLAYLRREDIPYLIAGDERVDLRLALEKMGDRLGVECVISTAGGRLNGALLRAGLVDEINVELFPAVIGGRETPSLFDAPALQPDEWPTRLELISARVQTDGNVWMRYRVLQE
jgi:2,5-diamino-6-(ribosylamino)-4(3H)-pyrimidinone 5'-phosphate reductase